VKIHIDFFVLSPFSFCCNAQKGIGKKKWKIYISSPLQFNASDVLKEVTVYEAIDKEGRYSYKVRRLGEFCRKRTVTTGSPY
jgi:hypothetical protein